MIRCHCVLENLGERPRVRGRVGVRGGGKFYGNGKKTFLKSPEFAGEIGTTRAR